MTKKKNLIENRYLNRKNKCPALKITAYVNVIVVVALYIKNIKRINFIRHSSNVALVDDINKTNLN